MTMMISNTKVSNLVHT